jgi:hypothetical protein
MWGLSPFSRNQFVQGIKLTINVIPSEAEGSRLPFHRPFLMKNEIPRHCVPRNDINTEGAKNLGFTSFAMCS